MDTKVAIAFLCSALCCTVIACSPVAYDNKYDEVFDPGQRALEVWTDVHGDIEQKCKYAVEHAKFEVMSYSGIEKQCGKGQIAACTERVAVNSYFIALLSTQEGTSSITRAHELVHVLAFCSGDKTGDFDHVDDAWKILEPSEDFRLGAVQ